MRAPYSRITPEALWRMRNPIDAPSPLAIDMADLLDAYQVAEQIPSLTPWQVWNIASKSHGRIGRKTGGRYWYSRDDVRRIRQALP